MKRRVSSSRRAQVNRRALPSAPARCYGRAMQEKFTALTPELYEYLVAHNPPPDPVLRDLAAETAALGPVKVMQIGSDQAAFLPFPAHVLGARRAHDIRPVTG